MAFSLTCRCRNWASRGSKHQEPPAYGSGGGDTELSFTHQLYFSIQKEELLLKWKAKVLFLLFFSQACLHTHTQRVAGSPEQRSEFPPEHIKAGIEEATDHDSKWSRLSRERNVLDISKAVSHSAQSLFAPCTSVLLGQNIKLPPALTKTLKSLSKPKLPIQDFFHFSRTFSFALSHEKQKAPTTFAVL